MADRRTQQWILTALLAGAAVLAFFVVARVMNDGSSGTRLSRNDPGVTTMMIADRTSGASAEMTWVTSGRESIDALQRQVSSLNEALKIAEANSNAKIEAVTKDYDEIIIEQQGQINELIAALAGSGVVTADPIVDGTDPAGGEATGGFLQQASARIGFTQGMSPLGPRGSSIGDPASAAQTTASLLPPRTEFARSLTLSASADGAGGGSEDDPIDLENYLPAGSYAPAIVLSGVDAGTGVTAQSEPIPVLFRINGPAVTAGTRSTNGHRIDLTGCTVTGSARGDLSSERVYVRLIKMACVLPGQEVFEADIAGYMSGSGKSGSRGLVTSREGKLVTAAGVAGALGGLASGLNTASNTTSGVDGLSVGDALSAAGAASLSGGVSSAANLLAEYYIERAEQYQPVVSLYGGTAVELVFMEGVKLD